MADDPDARRSPLWSEAARPFVVIFGLVATMWVLELIDTAPGVDLDGWGIEPRTLDGLLGIVASPFLHADLGHLLGNTIPFVVLGCVIAASGLRQTLLVTLIVALTAGIGTWLTGPTNTVHIGASGIVFGYLTYLIVRGFFARHLGQALLGIVVFLFYGSLLWGLLPAPGVSWQGHLFGAIGGVLAAWVLHRRPAADGSFPAQ
jgi:membrane associated rhomboid family serine protease